ncbi:hypothetical protein [Alloactinosynnema sp. L-07]|uniref:hypothetical protein n=1 Tax=Alloactinosynnema sp. L-07 TaxID=1653480 RepID=UPI00065EF2F5|nr:hypothetical protein [Alloactinosynnema sp. L-07]CRK56876.1 hypothetical protein [Alloactinosynnema sp. L-07]
MTKNYFRKKQIRAEASATGRTYLDAARQIAVDAGHPQGMLAAPLHEALAKALDAAGWPVDFEHDPLAGVLFGYAGPAVIQTCRLDGPPLDLASNAHPDDPTVFDLTSPISVGVTAPRLVDIDHVGRLLGLDCHEVSLDQPVCNIVAAIDAVLATTRHELVTMPTNAECAICGDQFSARDLLEPTSQQIRVCPCCVFSGELLDVKPFQLALQLNFAVIENLAVSAGWVGPQTLLSCLAGAGFADRLLRAWRRAGIRDEPMEWWSEPAKAWIWLPPGVRPSVLAQFGCGASLQRIITAIDTAYPELRAEVRTRAVMTPDGLVDQLWPAGVAFAVGLMTQQAEHVGRRSPWDVMDSFDLLYWVRKLAPDVGCDPVEAVLGLTIAAVRGALNPGAFAEDPDKAERSK